MNAGRSLRVALAKKDMSQKDLANNLGVSTAYISRLCSNPHISMGTVVSLANYFDMPVSDFLKLGEDDK